MLLWGLPGSGRRRLLASLMQRGEGQIGALSRIDASSPQRLSERLDDGRRAGITEWVCDGWGPESVSLLLAQAAIPERILASVDRLSEATAFERGQVGVIGPREWLLERQELDRCAGAGSRPDADLDALFEITGGWLRPLELALALAADLDRRALLEDSGLRGFLRGRVLPSLSPQETRELETATDGGVAGSRVSELAADRRKPLDLLRSLLDRRLDGRRLDGRRRASPRPDGRTPVDPGFQVSLLGAPEVVAAAAGAASDVGAPLRWPYRRVVSLLALLVLEPDRSLSQERVVEALWPDREIELARSNLDPAVSHLRRWLSGGQRRAPRDSCVLLVNGVYRLNPRWRWEVDVEEFERLASADSPMPDRRLEALERARRLYRGPLLEGFRGSWMRERRRRLGALYRRLLRELGDLYAGLGRIAESEDSYRSLLAVEPLEEEVHVAIMRLYARQGREDLVRRQYEKLSALLARELGIHPMDETIREVQRLLGR